jgi:proteic killer suppression protein
MIRTFRHKGLEQLFQTGQSRLVAPELTARIRRRLDYLNRAREVNDVNVPGFRLHELKGNRRGTWSMTVSGNQRLTFKFVDGHAFDVDLEDYH